MLISNGSIEQQYADIKTRINELEELSGEDLAGAMRQLKKALSENPDACQLMLPEDIGQMVAHLRRVTGQAVAKAAATPKTTRAAKAKPLTAEEMQAALDDL